MKRTAMFAGVCLAAHSALGQPTVYDPSTGASPTASCWDSAGFVGALVSDGVLEFSGTSASATRYFFRDDLRPIDFSGRLEVVARVRVDAGTLTAGGCTPGPAAGVGFSVADAAGRVFTVGLATNGVFIRTDTQGGSGPDNPAAALAWDGQMRTVRLTIDNYAAELWIDGVLMAAVNRPEMPAGESLANRVLFGGDISHCAPGGGGFERFSITAQPETGGGGIFFQEQPEPRTLCPGDGVVLRVQVSSPWTAAYQWRRDGVPLVDGEQPSGAVVSGAASPNLAISGFTPAESGSYDILVVNTCGTALSDPATLALPEQCGPADLGAQGGVTCPDGILNNNDFIVYISFFFAQDPRADVGSQGGEPGGDGAFDNNDFIVYINEFFTGC